MGRAVLTGVLLSRFWSSMIELTAALAASSEGGSLYLPEEKREAE